MIGILAGMGPKSTGPFVDTVVEQCQKIYGAKHDMDFPHMMIYSCPTPFYIDRPIDHKAMEKAIINGAQKLENTGVDFIAMPCNTAHLYFNQLQDSVSVPILNMVDKTIKEIPNHINKVALLATDATVQSGIYQDGIAKRGMDYIHKENWQRDTTQIISKIKAGNLHEASELWRTLCIELTEAVDAVIIACTDLNVVSGANPYNFYLVDSSTCLAQAVVNKYLSSQKS
ncbi:aspartate/glutamate racemase family protein [Bacillus pseudomycoides]|uniref:aspartate/glutamate racemase family protein n=1 Tax=Bacillus pseudomycoides TaxID=64104 RepID=UPI000BEC8C39|nr:amino acid racemase [Bacillus pseudomycoides]PED09513.1 amino-acid racemase [Bacillus pseudomycoides]PED72028.1 amino-acid racemase [Bacillus pseudomycoides]PEI41667.1 amino-acid racemase [Bacillus pseudomycoides]PEI89775.1 amino-acid racemase [Bacillus pseudomycoides]PEJ73723.1 amino-acid racemase [Bacillus pseudomycoides]